MEYTIENFKNGKFIIRCGTRKEAEELFEVLIKNSFKWRTGEFLTGDNHWSDYREDIYYAHDSINSGLSYGDMNGTGSRYKEAIFFKDFVFAEKSMKEKTIEIIGVEVGEQFNIVGESYNPHMFDAQFDLLDRDGDRSYSKIAEILWGLSKIEKIPKDPNAEVKKYIKLLSNETPLTKDVREGILLSLTEILELKESKSA